MKKRFTALGAAVSAGAHIVVGALFVGDGIQKLAYDGSVSGAPAAVVPFAGTVELIVGALVAARSLSVESESREQP